MRTALCIVTGLAVVVGDVPASFSQDSRANIGKPAGTGMGAKKRQQHQTLRPETGISLAVPIGRVWVDPEYAGGETVYERRTTVREGMTIVEVSTTPFTPVFASNEAPPGVRPDQPAGW